MSFFFKKKNAQINESKSQIIHKKTLFIGLVIFSCLMYANI